MGMIMLPIRVSNTFRIIAHRGASSYAPENTLSAFKLAFEMGCREVELDTQLSTDGVVVLCHDRTLERYGHGPSTVEEMSSKQLLGLDMGSWFSPHLYGGELMISIDKLFTTYGDSITYHVELKGSAPALPGAVAETISRHGLRDKCVVSSFSFDSLVAMREVDANIRLAWLVSEVNDGIGRRANEINLFQLCPRASLVTPVVVEKFHEMVEEVRAWGLKGARPEVISLIKNVVDSGCDGVTIDSPDWLRPW